MVSRSQCVSDLIGISGLALVLAPGLRVLWRRCFRGVRPLDDSRWQDRRARSISGHRMERWAGASFTASGQSPGSYHLAHLPREPAMLLVAHVYWPSDSFLPELPRLPP